MFLSKSLIVLGMASLALASLNSASAHSSIKCIKMERASDGSYTKCIPGSRRTTNFYVPHATSASYTGKICHNAGAPVQMAQIAAGETFTYVWTVNNHGELHFDSERDLPHAQLQDSEQVSRAQGRAGQCKAAHRQLKN